ncbi:SDR family oxidoreductase [Sphingomonas sp.]|uniref:SDR family NAD(P)-dependent oxidoreductase n=1 Tax=Sphingomonas sp. TaxID=28214 RepID=UPI000DB3B4F9|nr:SDR family oxidoreductase [Sphingomonas sp.]PZU10767.1 MAG: 3-oxoacyl-ACP reductase [Sphingomonas sp.]
MSGAAQSALVTGGGGGLGAAICRALHGAGYRVMVSDIDPAAAEKMAQSLSSSGDTAAAIRLDVTSRADLEAARDAMIARWGSAEILVNNAVLQRTTPVLDITDEEFNQVMAVNVRGSFVASQIFGRLFKDRGYGRIVNMASLAGQNGGTATGAHYAASKGAILTLTKVFARDLAAFGVTVNAISPGPLDLPSVRTLVPQDKLDGIVRAIPAGTLGDAAYVADLVLKLVAPDAGFVTGATWDVNGGLWMR